MFSNKFWQSGKIIALVSFLECLTKLAFSASDLVFGHFKNAVPNEARGEFLVKKLL
jgi:hypothetical protein